MKRIGNGAGRRIACAALAFLMAAGAAMQPADADARRGWGRSAMRSFAGAALGTVAGEAIWHGIQGRQTQAQPQMQGQAPGGEVVFPEGWRGNRTVPGFRAAKRLLKERIYFDDDRTLYCGARWNRRGEITELPEGFYTPAEEKRASRLEWEHAVPAENFGRAFAEWREGAPQCVKNGRPFKGRKCAETNQLFAFMEADMHNLHPSIGAVNAVRKNYRYTQFNEHAPNTFGSCAMKVDPQTRQAEPPDMAKGRVARSMLYMDWAYPAFNLSDQQRRLMEIWDRQFPPDRLECVREKRIKQIQGNGNPFVERACGETPEP
ncbi:MAG: endonuclease [Desulfovibrio sp.]|nr:endonuclease [Desulfovibrio sp.]